MKYSKCVINSLFLITFTSCTASAIKLAQTCLSEGNVIQAKRILHIEIEEKPDSGRALMLLGIIAMEEEDFKLAHTYFDKAKACSYNITLEVESRYEPLLEYLESIDWVHIRTAPSAMGLHIVRFPGPLIVEDIEEVQDEWAKICYRSWMPNDENVDHYKQLFIIDVLFETPEMAYVEIKGWAPKEKIQHKEYLPVQQGVHLEIDLLDSVPTKDGGKVLVFGTVTNRGSITALNPRAIITAMSLNFGLGMMGYSTSVDDPMGAPPPMVLDYLSRNFINVGEATVPIQPRNLGPGQTGIIVLTIEVENPQSYLSFRAELEHGPPY